MTEQQTDDVLAAIADALADAELTVDELTTAIVERTGSVGRRPGDAGVPGDVAAVAAGALPGRRPRRALLRAQPRSRRHVHESPTVAAGHDVGRRRPAPADLLRRYLSAYGPATPQHFARWLNASPTWAAELFASLDDELEPVEVEDTAAWQLAGEVAGPDAEGVRLLPYFDAYAVAGQPRTLLFPGPAWDRALARGQAGNFPVLLVDGTVAGVWHHRRAGRKVAVTVEPLGRLTAGRRRELEQQVARVGEILEATAELTVGTGVGRPARLTSASPSIVVKHLDARTPRPATSRARASA